ncbi:SDR family NAD(P)-dependent oxidoreductase [Nocardioides zeae]|uniref:SDR family oxidoreductase n=1 Tax=Nocardioides zeae TaxID=1457234 RepID=A0A6P0HII3_9ACTN|nr:SDR family NAD(P)-dependent oxidoreductase [Nocardioides zeae]NEN78549.1 SDR family oxidoreductase [Nocardioides zeae]
MGEQPGTVVVTGAASGIGEATVRLLHERGHAVVLVDRDAAGLDRVAGDLGGDRLLVVAADVAAEEDVAAYDRAAVEAFGRYDGVFLNAAVPGRFASLADTEVDEFDEVVAVDLRGVFLGLRAALRHFAQRPGGGRIVTTSSVAGLTAGTGLAAYTGAKHGVIGLTRVAAVEGAPLGVRANCLAPGMTDTPLQAPLKEFHGESGAGAMVAGVPLGRLGRPSEAAELACFLLGPEAGYLTGAVIPIDGGALAASPLG